MKPTPKKKDLESNTIAEIRAMAARNKIVLPRQAIKSTLIQTLIKGWKKLEKAATKKVPKKTSPTKSVAKPKNKKVSGVEKKTKAQPKKPSKTIAKKNDPKKSADPKKTAKQKEKSVTGTKTSPRKTLKSRVKPLAKPKASANPYKPVARAEDDWQQPHTRDNLTLLLRDPQWLYAYWHIQSQTIDRLQKRNKSVDFNQARLLLRIFEIHGADANDKELIATYFPYSGAHAYYMHVPGCGRCYSCEIGFETKEGNFLLVTDSNQVGTPQNVLSEVFDSSWITLENYKKVFSETPAAFKDLESKRYILEEALQKAGQSWSGGITDSEALTSLSSEALSQLSSYIIEEISSFNLSQVSSAMIGELSSKIIHALSSEILASLSSQVLTELSSQAIHEVSSREMQSLSSEVFQNLSSQSLEILSSEVLQSLSSQVIQSLSSQAVGQLASQVFRELSETAWSQISSEVLGGLASQVFSGMASELFQSLSSQVLTSLSSEALQSMASELHHLPTSSFALSSSSLSSSEAHRSKEPDWEEPVPTWAIPSCSERVLPTWSSFKVPVWPRGN